MRFTTFLESNKKYRLPPWLGDQAKPSRAVGAGFVLTEGRLKPVAEALGLSIHTVRTQKENLMRKLGVKNTIELARSAARRGLVGSEEFVSMAAVDPPAATT